MCTIQHTLELLPLSFVKFLLLSLELVHLLWLDHGHVGTDEGHEAGDKEHQLELLRGSDFISFLNLG